MAKLDDDTPPAEDLIDGQSSENGDPWLLKQEKNGRSEEKPATTNNSFEDSFKPFVKLPDSKEYLNSLEARLAKVQKKGSIVRDLQQRRQDEMKRFLDGEP